MSKIDNKRKITLERVLKLISYGKCLNCERRIADTMPNYRWQLPLCRNCRVDAMGGVSQSDNKLNSVHEKVVQTDKEVKQ